MRYTEAAFQADLCGIHATGVVQALAIVRDHLAHGTSPDDALALAEKWAEAARAAAEEAQAAAEDGR